MARRRYSDEDKASALAALKANGGMAGRTAKQLGIPLTTLRHWRDGQGIAFDAELGRRKESDAAQEYEDIAELARQRAKAALPDASAYQAAIVAGTFTDKARLLRGEATEIHSTLLEGMDQDALGEMLRGLLREQGEREAAARPQVKAAVSSTEVHAYRVVQ